MKQNSNYLDGVEKYQPILSAVRLKFTIQKIGEITNK